MGESPDVRIGTAEREEAIRRLSDHFSAGRLSVAEFDERSAVVAAAVTKGDLVKVFTDLPEPAAAAGRSASAAAVPGVGRAPDLQGPLVGLAVIAAVVLFLTTHIWLWFLIIPAAGIVTGAIGNSRHRHDRRQRRPDRRDRRNRHREV